MLLYAFAQINETALRHVLRSFRTMSRGGEAEKQLARLLMLPFIDLNFTQVGITEQGLGSKGFLMNGNYSLCACNDDRQGRLDGGSRGSCGGLKEIYR